MLKGNLSPKIKSYGNILPRNCFSYIFEFQLVPLGFILILRDPFMVSPSPTKECGGGVFSKKCFSWGKIFVGKMYRGIVLHRGTNDQIVPTGKEFHKMHFRVI